MSRLTAAILFLICHAILSIYAQSNNTDACDNYCTNGGRCLKVGNRPYCDCCGTDAVGQHCEVDLCCRNCPPFAKCSGRPKCFCHCPQGFSGPNCEKEACGGSYAATDVVSSIQSALYPRGCTANENCFWSLYAADQNKVVSLTLTDIRPGTCNSSALSIVDGVTMQPLLFQPCGSEGRTVYSKSNKMLVHLQSLTRFQSDCGFVAHYKQVPKNNTACSYNSCQNGGTCVQQNEGYMCFCAPGYYGQHCEAGEMTTQPWTRHTTTNVNFTTTRDRPTHYPYTTQQPETCKNVSCMNGGTCYGDATYFYCVCAPSYSGRFCEFPIRTQPWHPTTSAPSGNNTTTANPWWTTTMGQCYNGACRNGGTCSNYPGGFYCYCPAGFFGRFCENFATTYQPSNHTLMTTGRFNFTTTPYPWYTTTPKPWLTTTAGKCHDGSCKNGGTCMGYPGGFYCICPQDFFGRFCEFTQSYTSFYPPNITLTTAGRNNFTSATNPWYSTYVHTTGRSNYTTTGYWRTTTPNDMCYDGACKNGGSCNGYPGGFYCTCPQNYFGRFCEFGQNVTTFFPSNSTHTTPRPNITATFPFTTASHYRTTTDQQGRTTSRVLENCSTQPCQNGGTCNGNQYYFWCLCPAGFSGRVCEVTNSTTPQQVVSTGPIIFTTGAAPRTSTTLGITSRKPTGKCAKEVCQNGGTCRNEGLFRFKCDCLPGFQGNHCEKSN